MTVHLAMTRDGNACGRPGPSDPDINNVTCGACIAIHDGDEECNGECIQFPHKWTYGSENQFHSAICQNPGCNIIGTGDPCGDGNCTGHPDYVSDEEEE